jgi:hypothetical protein
MTDPHALHTALRQRDYAHALLRALALAGHIPDGPWRRLINAATDTGNARDNADADTQAASLVWVIENGNHQPGTP